MGRWLRFRRLVRRNACEFLGVPGWFPTTAATWIGYGLLYAMGGGTFVFYTLRVASPRACFTPGPFALHAADPARSSIGGGDWRMGSAAGCCHVTCRQGKQRPSNLHMNVAPQCKDLLAIFVMGG